MHITTTLCLYLEIKDTNESARNRPLFHPTKVPQLDEAPTTAFAVLVAILCATTNNHLNFPGPQHGL